MSTPSKPPKSGPKTNAGSVSRRGAPELLHPDVIAAQTRDVFAVLLAFRFFNALCVRTFFQPDEYFQALEPAWNLAFGPDSGAWLTWEWQYQLRASMHPVIFGFIYMAADKILALFQCFPPLRALLLVFLPKAVQSVFAGLGDYYTWKLSERIYGRGSRAAWTTLWLTILNPWQWFCSTRTFSNSLETTITIIALYHWPWELLGDIAAAAPLQSRKSINSLRISLFLAAMAVILRPTNILIWAGIALLTVTRMTLDGKSAVTFSTAMVLLRESALCGFLALAISAGSDRLYFGTWTFPPLQMLYFNVSHDIAVFYGHMDWHYYLSQGIPLLTTTFLPFALFSLYKSSTSRASTPVLQSNILKTLSFTVLTMIGVLSVIAHKEVRFIYPLLPILHILAAPYINNYFIAEPASSASPTSLKRGPLLAFLIFANIIIGVYLSMFHQGATISVLTFLRTEYERLHPDHLDLHPPHPSNHYHTLSSSALSSPASDPDAIISAAGGGDELFVLFLTPCHSTPWRSHLVYPSLRARALTCEPPLDTPPRSAERRNYRDETDRFYAREDGQDGQDGRWGHAFLNREVWPLLTSGDSDDAHRRGGEIPRFIVGFEGVEEMLREYFDVEKGGGGAEMGVTLTRVWDGFNGLFNEEATRQGRLVVWDTGVYPTKKEGTGI